MTRRHQAFDARDYRNVDDATAFDERGVLKDGYGVRVPLEFMDSTQRAVARDARRRTTQRDPQGRLVSTYTEEEEEESDAMTIDAELALHRPGYRSSVTVNDDEAAKAYREYVSDQANAWKKRDAQPRCAYPRAAGVGTACTINGAPGVRVESDDPQWLVCKPVSRGSDAVVPPTTMGAATAQHIRDAAWREYCERTRDAWKTNP